MRKYDVKLCYTGYVNKVIEADDEQEAIEKAEMLGTAGIDDLSRWEDADMVEEITE